MLKHNNIIFVMQYFMFLFNETSSGINLQIF